MDSQVIDSVEYQLPCIVAVQVGLSTLLRSFGIEPTAVMGHSSGDMVAAWFARLMSLENLALLTFARAEAQKV